MELKARVGAGASSGNNNQQNSAGRASTVRLPGTNIIAPGGLRAGSSGGGRNGGDGYSGGGGGGWSSGGYGGTNGNDGGDGSGHSNGDGGSGTWEDITAYEMTEFTLSPGQGGQAYRHSQVL